MTTVLPPTSGLIRKILILAGLYYLLCGICALIWPASWYLTAGIAARPAPIELGVVGALMLAWGCALCVAANALGAAWLVVLMTAIHSILDMLVVMFFILRGNLPALNGIALMAVDLAWAAALIWVLAEFYRTYLAEFRGSDLALRDALNFRPLGSDLTLAQISDESPLAFVLLRHAGCTFCREYLSYLAKEQTQLQKRGIRLALVSMSRPDAIRDLAIRYGLADALLVSDPAQSLYRAFGMRRGRIKELFGVPEFVRAIVGGRLFKFGIGWIDGDGFQLGGCTLVYRGQIVAVRAATRASQICSVSEMVAEEGA